MTADPEAAAYWYCRATEKGDARAAPNHGHMLIRGIVFGIGWDDGAGKWQLEGMLQTDP